MLMFHSNMYSHYFWRLRLRESCAIMFLICHVVTWPKFMLPSVWVLFHRSHKIWFTNSILFWSFGYHNLGHLLQNEIENSYLRVITKCNIILNAMYVRYYKVCQKFITKCIGYYKVWQTVITKCVRYYKVWQLSLTLWKLSWRAQ